MKDLCCYKTPSLYGEIPCLFCQNDKVDKIYKTSQGDFCLYHLPIKEKKKLLDEDEIHDFQNKLKDAIKNGFQCYGVQAIGEINIRDVEIDEICLAHAIFEAQFSISHSKIRNADFSYAIFKEHANFGNTRFEGFVNFHNTRFNKFARFKYATFFAITDFSDVIFDDYANFKNSTFGETIPLMKGETVSIFKNALFKERADFKDCKFTVDIDFEGCTFENRKNYTSFESAEFNKTINFSNCFFGGPFYCNCAANVGDNLKYIFNVNFYGSTFNNYVSFNNRIFR